MLPLAPLLLSLLVPLGGDDRNPDSVRLKDGGELGGRVVLDGPQQLILRQGSREIELALDEVEEVRSLERSLVFLLEHARVVPAENLRGLLDLGRICKERGLPGIADLVHYRVLLVDPENAEAHEALEHRRRQGEWTGPLDQGWHRWPQLLELRLDWNNAWEFETAHYQVRTNLDLEAAVDAVLDLERFYLFFHEAVGSELGIRTVSAPLSVHLHGDEESYPEIARDRPGWYDPQSRIVHIDGTRAFLRSALMHEATHQLFEVGKGGLVDAGVKAPAWLGEGLAEYLAHSATSPLGQARFQSGRLALMHVYNHADAEEPLPLDAILSLSASDFLVERGSELRYGQSYSLVHFCLHGEDGRHRNGFFEYLKDARAGRGSPASFEQHVARDVPEFERAWAAYVKRLSGGR